jgi:hypothetical protein
LPYVATSSSISSNVHWTPRAATGLSSSINRVAKCPQQKHRSGHLDHSGADPLPVSVRRFRSPSEERQRLPAWVQGSR